MTDASFDHYDRRNDDGPHAYEMMPAIMLHQMEERVRSLQQCSAVTRGNPASE